MIALAVGLALLIGLPSEPAVAGGTKILAALGELFNAPLHRYALINPSGRYIAVVYAAGRSEGLRVHDVDRVERAEVVNPRRCKCWIVDVRWIDDELLLVGRVSTRWGHARATSPDYVVVDFASSGEELEFHTMGFRPQGIVIDTLPHRGPEILFAPSSKSNSVYRLNVRKWSKTRPQWAESSESKPASNQPLLVATLPENVISWISDSKGSIRSAMTMGGEPPTLKIWYRRDSETEMKVVREETAHERFDDVIPLGVVPNEERLLVASSLNRDRYGLYEYDPQNDEMMDLVYEHPSAELIGLAYDYSGKDLLAAIYLEEGEQRYAYLGTDDEELSNTLQMAFSDRSVSLTGLSRDRRRASVMVTSSDDPGAYWVIDIDSGGATELGRIRPWLDNNILASTRSFRVPSADGLEIEGFLTLPPLESAEPPLVVMPHGGPIGIGDRRAFSPEIQYLARSGFAVLQVNYRGSSGYGKKFELAGNREWGRGIEDDIDTAVEFVIAQGWVDENRMCTVGTSYGGYSALMTVIRHPTRYRCAASLMGVTDISLLFNSDAVFAGEAVVTKMKEIVGDPDADYLEHRKYSPVYNADKIRVPVYLAHGELDRRVDIDHMVRMKLALELARVPIQVFRIPKTGHGFPDREGAIKYYKTLRAFLVQNLAN